MKTLLFEFACKQTHKNTVSCWKYHKFVMNGYQSFGYMYEKKNYVTIYYRTHFRNVFANQRFYSLNDIYHIHWTMELAKSSNFTVYKI